MEWYYAVGGQRVGPVSQADFDRLAHEGVIKPDTLVWRQGLAAWQPLSSVAAGAGEAGAPPTLGDDGTEMCAVSGKRYPRREMIQFEGKWISAEHRDAYFQRIREGVIQPGNVVYAGFWRRLVAKIVDGIVIWVVSMIVNVLLVFVFFGSFNIAAQADPKNLTPFLLFQGFSVLLNIAMALAYSIFFIRRFNATPGKMALGLKLLRADGTSLSVGRIVGRYFAEMISSIILFIGYILAAFDEQKRALHDHICDTRVVKVQ